MFCSAQFSLDYLSHLKWESLLIPCEVEPWTKSRNVVKLHLIDFRQSTSSSPAIVDGTGKKTCSGSVWSESKDQNINYIYCSHGIYSFIDQNVVFCILNLFFEPAVETAGYILKTNTSKIGQCGGKVVSTGNTAGFTPQPGFSVWSFHIVSVCVCMRVRGRRGGGSLGPQISSSSSFYDPEMYRWMMFTRIIFHFVTPSGLLRKVSGWSEPLKIPAQRPLVFKMNLSVCLTDVLCVCFWPLRMFWF